MSNDHTNTSNLDILNEIKTDAIIYSACLANKRLSKYLRSSKSKYLNIDKHEKKDIYRQIDSDALIDLPTIQRKLSLFSRYKLVDNSVSFVTYIADWLFFISMNFVNNKRTTLAIYSILSDRVKVHGESNACAMLDKLWADRWIVNCDEYLMIRLTVTQKNINQDKLTFPDIIESHLDHAKQNSSSLDEWFENLYRLMPLALYGHLLYAEDESEDGKTLCRYFDEIGADIYGIIGSCMSEGVIKGKNEALTDMFLNPVNKTEDDILSLRRELSYNLRARVTWNMITFVKKWLIASKNGSFFD
jgi:hypothetical protein